MILHKLS